MNDELPVINDVSEIAPFTHPDMYKELGSGCEEGESANV